MLIAACRHAPQEDLLAQGEQLCREQKWDEAIRPLKAYLLEHPKDAAAHFYLGRCYLNGTMLYPLIAEGEFNAALMLFNENGRHSPIPEFPDDYFDLRCHLEIAKVYMRMFLIAKDHGAGPLLKQKILADLRKKAAEAERLAPDSQDVKELKKIIEQFQASASLPR